MLLPKKSTVLPEQLQRVSGLILLGYKPIEIAALLGLARYTVHYYIQFIYRELGIHSREELLAYAPPTCEAKPAGVQCFRHAGTVYKSRRGIWFLCQMHHDTLAYVLDVLEEERYYMPTEKRDWPRKEKSA